LALECPTCQTRTDVFRPLSRVSFEEGLCPTCDQLRQVELTHVITGSEPFLDRTLWSIGVPPLQILRARNNVEYRFYELTGDVSTALHFSGSLESRSENPMVIRPNSNDKRIKLGERTEPETEKHGRIRLGS
jgi:hypothetical protein